MPAALECPFDGGAGAPPSGTTGHEDASPVLGRPATKHLARCRRSSRNIQNVWIVRTTPMAMQNPTTVAHAADHSNTLINQT